MTIAQNMPIRVNIKNEVGMYYSNTWCFSRYISRQPNTKHKMSAKVFWCCCNSKIEEAAWIILCFSGTTTKSFGWHLVFSVWFLVTGRCNDKNIKYYLLQGVVWKHVYFSFLFNSWLFFITLLFQKISKKNLQKLN